MTPEEQIIDICRRCCVSMISGQLWTAERPCCMLRVCLGCPWQLEIEMIAGNHPDLFEVNLTPSGRYYIAFTRRCGYKVHVCWRCPSRKDVEF